VSNFLGTFSFAVDEKGRFSIPSHIRSGLAGSADGTFVVSRGLDGCLDAYPLDEWTRRIKLLRSLPNKRSGRLYKRLIVGGAKLCKMDGHKRILVPPDMLKSVGIDGTVLIIGQLDHLEFWAPDAYQAYLAEHDTPIEDVLEELEDRMDRTRPDRPDGFG
jgi:MraZ protein